METFKCKNKLFRKIYIKIYRLLKTNVRVKYPKKVSDPEKVVSNIFLKTLVNPETQLYYNIENSECSLKNEKDKLFIFLEKNNIKVINSTFGYDRHIFSDLEEYLIQRFIRENTKRRTQMKEEAIKKVDNSLSKTLDKLNKV